jgi:predicted enzyme related to lactoylglutathione lyase
MVETLSTSASRSQPRNWYGNQRRETHQTLTSTHWAPHHTLGFCTSRDSDGDRDIGLGSRRRIPGALVIRGARYAHTNLIARDWRRLAAFYQQLFACELVPPERDYSGPTLEAGTGVPEARLQGVHLRLPGHGADGPTLEIYTYSHEAARASRKVNQPGFAHIAFEVHSVGEARAQVLAAGGRAVGEIVTLTTAIGSRVTWCYVTDPEGNIIELQSWG